MRVFWAQLVKSVLFSNQQHLWVDSEWTWLGVTKTLCSPSRTWKALTAGDYFQSESSDVMDFSTVHRNDNKHPQDLCWVADLCTAVACCLRVHACMCMLLLNKLIIHRPVLDCTWGQITAGLWAFNRQTREPPPQRLKEKALHCSRWQHLHLFRHSVMTQQQTKQETRQRKRRRKQRCLPWCQLLYRGGHCCEEKTAC